MQIKFNNWGRYSRSCYLLYMLNEVLETGRLLPSTV